MGAGRREPFRRDAPGSIRKLELGCQAACCGLLTGAAPIRRSCAAGGAWRDGWPGACRRRSGSRRASPADRKRETPSRVRERLSRTRLALVPYPTDWNRNGPDPAAPAQDGPVEGFHVPGRFRGRESALLGRLQSDRIGRHVRATGGLAMAIGDNPHPIPARSALAAIVHRTALQDFDSEGVVPSRPHQKGHAMPPFGTQAPGIWAKFRRIPR